MGYEQALENAWGSLSAIAGEKRYEIRLLSDNYEIRIDDKTVSSMPCNVPAKDHVSIILLHYLAERLKLGYLPSPTGDWIDFHQLENAQGYYPAFKKRTVDYLIKKYGAYPDDILKAANSLPIEKLPGGDIGLIIHVLEGVPIRIMLWRADDEFGTEINILFDKGISKFFCVEDVVVLTEFVVRML